MDVRALVSLFAGLGIVALGAVMLAGAWRSAHAVAARDPARAAHAEGVFLTVIGALVAGKGVLLFALAPDQERTVLPWAMAVILAALAVGLVPLLRARRR